MRTDTSVVKEKRVYPDIFRIKDLQTTLCCRIYIYTCKICRTVSITELFLFPLTLPYYFATYISCYVFISNNFDIEIYRIIVFIIFQINIAASIERFFREEVRRFVCSYEHNATGRNRWNNMRARVTRLLLLDLPEVKPSTKDLRAIDA